MFQSDVVDQLHDDDGLTHARASEQSDFSTAQVRFEKIDHLDAALEHLQLSGLLVERGSLAMNGPFLRGIHRTHVVHRLADDVHDAAQGFISHRNFHAVAQADCLHPAHHAVGGLQRDGADAAFADMLRYFHHHVDRDGSGKAFAGDVDGRVDDGNLVLGELNVDGWAGHLDDVAYHLRCCCGCHKYLFCLSSGLIQC